MVRPSVPTLGRGGEIKSACCSGAAVLGAGAEGAGAEVMLETGGGTETKKVINITTDIVTI